MRLRFVLVATSISLVGAGCSSDDAPVSTIAAVTTVATIATIATTPTACAQDEAGDRPTVTIDVDDDADGFGRFGLQTPDSLPAGMIRLVVNAVEDNTDPVSVTVTTAGETVFEFVQVESGVQCAADVELAAGDYTVTFGDKTKTFTVDPQ